MEMKYDIYTLQILQEVVEWVKEDKPYGQIGLCREIRNADPCNFLEIRNWMHNKYMPDKSLKIYWWPLGDYLSDEVLEQSKKDRIAFLERIIEDLMCGE
jgi:hypothetical protein